MLDFKANPFEEYLCDKASLNNIPISGTFELLPTCNMNCKMCYVRMEQKEVNQLGGLQDKKFWLDIAKQAKEKGLLFLLLTGGEPLLYPEFFELYEELRNMGIYLTVNTNGTLIGEKEAKFFGDHRPRRLNITVYGKDNATYEALCNNANGFSQLENAIYYLKKYDVPIKLNCSLTVYNYNQLDDIRKLAEKWDLPIEIAYYMMPPNRKMQKGNYNEHRLSPEQAAEAAFNILTYQMTAEEKQLKIKEKLRKINEFTCDTQMSCGFWCRAANASFWVNWMGELVPCGIMNGPALDLKKMDFSTSWKKLINKALEVELSSKCFQCDKQSICPHCAASEISETNQYGAAPDYLCKFSAAYLDILKKEGENEIIL